MNKRLLILQWNSVNDNFGVAYAFKKLGFTCSLVDLNGQDSRLQEHEEFFDEYLKKNKFELIYSTNYFSYLAKVAHKYGIPYIAWAYDSPTKLDDGEYLEYDTTNVFLFDSCEVMKYRDRQGLKNIHYLPLAADIDRFNSTLSKPYNINRYTTDISFVGSLYDSEINNYLNDLQDYKKGMFNAVVDYCVGKYDINVAETLNAFESFYWEDEPKFSESVINDKKLGALDTSKDKSSLVSARVARLLLNSVTNKERLILISILSNHWPFKLYSSSSHEIFKTTEECGVVDYYSEMPLVFRNSRINLNITNKGIKAGMPLRCLDIMGCGGLLLSNYQRDFNEDFKDGESILIYHTFEEAFDKCKYYLSHESERARIAKNGCETVKKAYTYPVLIRRALKLADLGYLVKK